MGRSAAQWDSLVRFGSYTERRDGAGNLRCPPEILARLAADDEDGVRRAAVANPRCPQEALTAAADSSDPQERWTALRNPALPASVLARAATDRDPRVRGSVARNPNCPPELLTRLSADAVADVRCFAVAHPNCPVERIVRAAAGNDHDMAIWAARNESCPPPILARLAARHSSEASTAGTFPAQLTAAVAGNASTPPEALRRIARSCGDAYHDNRYLWNLADNPATPADVLHIWARSSSLPAPEVIAARPDCPPEVLAAIASPGLDYPLAAAVAAASHPNCPKSTLTEILKTGSEVAFARQMAAFSNPNCPSKIQRRHSRDPFFCSRWDAAKRRGRSTPDPDGRAPDRDRRKTYRGESSWPRPLDEPLVMTVDDARDVITAALADPDLRSRYPHIADWDHDGVAIDFTVRSDRPASGYSPSGGYISIQAGVHPKVVLHELAHKIVEDDRRYLTQPFPALHGREFTAAMLDLVEVRYGPDQRAVLRDRYEAAKAPLDRWDAPLSTVGQPAAGQLLDPGRSATKRPWTRTKATPCGWLIGQDKRRRCRHLVSPGSRQCAARHPVSKRR